jgi:hypothetical protein
MLTVQRMNVAFTFAEMAACACANKHETSTQERTVATCHVGMPSSYPRAAMSIRARFSFDDVQAE